MSGSFPFYAVPMPTQKALHPGRKLGIGLSSTLQAGEHLGDPARFDSH